MHTHKHTIDHMNDVFKKHIQVYYSFTHTHKYTHALDQVIGMFDKHIQVDYTRTCTYTYTYKYTHASNLAKEQVDMLLMLYSYTCVYIPRSNQKHL